MSPSPVLSRLSRLKASFVRVPRDAATRTVVGVADRRSTDPRGSEGGQAFIDEEKILVVSLMAQIKKVISRSTAPTVSRPRGAALRCARAVPPLGASTDTDCPAANAHQAPRALAQGLAGASYGPHRMPGDNGRRSNVCSEVEGRRRASRRTRGPLRGMRLCIAEEVQDQDRRTPSLRSHWSKRIGLLCNRRMDLVK